MDIWMYIAQVYHLKAQHELVRLVALRLLLQVAVLLHVRAVVLEDVDRVLGHHDLLVACGGGARVAVKHGVEIRTSAKVRGSPTAAA